MHEENNMWNELEGVVAEALIFNEYLKANRNFQNKFIQTNILRK